jgi:Uma2 family endonuclease
LGYHGRYYALLSSALHEGMITFLVCLSSYKFSIYAALGVPEIWRYDGSQAYFYHLAGEQYVEMSHSQAFPFLSSTVLGQFMEQSKTDGQDVTLDTAREWVRVNKPAGNS